MRVAQGLGWAWEKAFTVMRVGWGAVVGRAGTSVAGEA